MTQTEGVCPVCRRRRPLVSTTGVLREHPRALGRPAMCAGGGQAPAVVEHRAMVVVAQGFGPMAGYRWTCVCGLRGKAVHGRRHADAGAAAHVERMAKRAGGAQ